MNRLANALAFAVVVIAAFVMDARSSCPQLVPTRLMSRVVHTLRSTDIPAVVATEPPAIDRVELDRVMERAQTAQHELARAEMRRVESRVRARAGASGCNVVRLDQ